MAGRIPISDSAIAEVAVTTLLRQILETEKVTEPSPVTMAAKLLASTSRIQFQPSTRRLVLSFDLGMSPDEDGD